VDGYLPEHFMHSVADTTVNGKPICYLVNQQGTQVTQDCGYVAAINCTNIIIRNQYLTQNREGLLLAYTENSVVKNTKLENNLYGIYVQSSGNNRIYHNTLINNSVQCYSQSSVNEWDNGYPSGGNSWSDYSGNDTHSGPNQNETGTDGIGDTPYPIDTNNADHYPVLYSWTHLPVHNVNTFLHYHTIQEAIDAPETMNGHTINIDPGNYYGLVTVSKALTLIGEDLEYTILNADSGRAFDVLANDVHIEGFTVRGANGILIRNSSNSTVCHNKVKRIANGIILSNSSSCMIANNVVEGEGYMSAGIVLESGSTRNVVRDNWISGDSSTGVKLGPYADSNLIQNNSISRNDFGIQFSFSTDNIIVGNMLLENNNSISMDNSNHNVIYHNNFIANTTQSTGASSSNYWNSSYPLGGNYWSDYSGKDMDLDGLGDVPYAANADNVDYYPLMGRFTDFNSSVGYDVDIVSNSTIDDFAVFEHNNTIKMHVSNSTMDQAFGFCRIRVPHSLMNEPYEVTVDGETPYYVNYMMFDDGENRWIYFSYQQSTREVTIIPELAQTLMAPILLTLAMVAVTISKWRGFKKTKVSRIVLILGVDS